MKNEIEASSPTLILLLVSAVLLGRSDAIKYSTRSSQQLVDKWIANRPAGAVAVAVVSPEDTEYFFGGRMSSNNHALPDEHTMFEIGSITKPFTGLLLADQVVSDNINLLDTISELLTDWPGRFSAPAGIITMLELAIHASGLASVPDNMVPPPLPDNPYANYTKEKLYRWLDTVKLVNRGSFLYSNAGAGILGHALEVSGKKKYAEFLKERVLTPLGLEDTTITLNSDQRNRLAPGHDTNGKQVSNWDLDVLAPAGALRSCVSEFVRFLRFATGIQEIPEEMGDALRLTTIPRGIATPLPDGRNVTSDTIGLFWLQSILPDEKMLIWHSGGTGGYNSYLGWVPERQVGVVVLASITPTQMGTTEELALNLLKMKLGI